MGGASSRLLSATGLKGLINKAGLPLQVDDEFDSDSVKDPSRVSSVSSQTDSCLTAPHTASSQTARKHAKTCFTAGFLVSQCGHLVGGGTSRWRQSIACSLQRNRY